MITVAVATDMVKVNVNVSLSCALLRKFLREKKYEEDENEKERPSIFGFGVFARTRLT